NNNHQENTNAGTIGIGLSVLFSHAFSVIAFFVMDQKGHWSGPKSSSNSSTSDNRIPSRSKVERLEVTHNGITDTLYMSQLKETNNQYAQEFHCFLCLCCENSRVTLMSFANCLWYEDSRVSLSFADCDIEQRQQKQKSRSSYRLPVCHLHNVPRGFLRSFPMAMSRSLTVRTSRLWPHRSCFTHFRNDGPNRPSVSAEVEAREAFKMLRAYITSSNPTLSSNSSTSDNGIPSWSKVERLEVTHNGVTKLSKHVTPVLVPRSDKAPPSGIHDIQYHLLLTVGNSCFLCLGDENSRVSLSFADYGIGQRSPLTSLYPNVTFLISVPLVSLIPSSARVLNTDPTTLGASRISSPIMKEAPFVQKA
ncbi:nucleoside-triphosphatases, partial [Striga asiatica]